MMSFFYRVLVFLSLMVLGIIDVSAQPLNDPKTSFSVDLDYPKTSNCVVYPNKPYNPDQCPIDNYLFPTEDASMIARGVIRFEGGGEMLFNMAYMKAPFTAPMSAKEAQFPLSQYMELFNASEMEQIDSGMRIVNQQPFFRYYVDIGTDTALPYTRILFYAFSGKGYHYFISFNFDSAQEKKAFEISNHILNSIHVPKPKYSQAVETSYQLIYEVTFSAALFFALFLFSNSGSWLLQRLFPRKEGKSFFHGQGICAIEGITRFIALMVLIIGFYELVTAFKHIDIAGIFLIIYACGLVLFIMVRQIIRWIRRSPTSEFLGKPLPGKQIFFPISVRNFVLLSIFTAGFYSFYWFYRNWEYIQQTESKLINPILKAIFYPITAYFLFNQIRRYGQSRGEKVNLPAGFLAFSLIVCFLIDMLPLGYVIPQLYWFAVSFLMFILEFALLIPAVKVINKLNGRFAPQADFNDSFSRSEVVVCVIGASFILLWTVFFIVIQFL